MSKFHRESNKQKKNPNPEIMNTQAKKLNEV